MLHRVIAHHFRSVASVEVSKACHISIHISTPVSFLHKMWIYEEHCKSWFNTVFKNLYAHAYTTLYPTSTGEYWIYNVIPHIDWWVLNIQRYTPHRLVSTEYTTLYPTSTGEYWIYNVIPQIDWWVLNIQHCTPHSLVSTESYWTYNIVPHMDWWVLTHTDQIQHCTSHRLVSTEKHWMSQSTDNLVSNSLAFISVAQDGQVDTLPMKYLRVSVEVTLFVLLMCHLCP